MQFSFNTGRSPDFLNQYNDAKNAGSDTKKSNPKTGLILGSITAIIGLLVVIFGVYSGNADKRLIDSGTRVEAVVSDVDYDLKSNGSNSKLNTDRKFSKITTVSFTASDGKNYTTQYSQDKQFVGLDQRLSPQEDIGKKEIVFYDASNPSKAVVEGHATNTFVISLIGGVALLIGSVIVVSSRAALKKKSEDQD